MESLGPGRRGRRSGAVFAVSSSTQHRAAAQSPNPLPRGSSPKPNSPLPDGVDTVGRGTAKFEQNPDGSDILVVDTENLQQADGYYQVWLINPQTSGLVSLGTVGSGRSR